MATHRADQLLDERSLFAEYPFLPGSEALLEGEEVSVRSLLEHPAYQRARTIGEARILAGAEDPRGLRDVSELAGAPGDVRFLSFLFARLVLSAGPTAAALRRWAVSEAKRSYSRLANVSVEELSEVARRLGYTFETGRESVAVPLVDYVRLSVPIREADFRLASQEVRKGSVLVPRVRAARLLQEAVRLRLAQPLPVAPEVSALVREREAELFEDLARRTPAPVTRTGIAGGPIRPELFPPCIRKMQRTLQSGENLSHAGRFGLAAFLHRAGADFETIVDQYRGAPDFDESITRYQVEHITLRDGGRGYEPPECDTLRSHGLCAREGEPTAAVEADRVRDPRCFDETLRHPLQYYRRRGGSVVERGDADASAPAATPGAGAPDTREGRGRPPSTGRRG